MKKLVVLLAAIGILGWVFAVTLDDPGAGSGAGSKGPAGPTVAAVPEDAPAITAVPLVEAVSMLGSRDDGRLVLWFHHDREPVAGVVAEIRARADSSSASGDDGLIAWDLPPGAYRWEHTSRENLTVLPAQPMFVPATGEGFAVWTASSSVNPKLSAEFTIEAGRERRFECAVERGTVLSGALPPQTTPDAAPWNTVRLLHHVIDGHPSGDWNRRMESLLEAGNVVVGEDRRFRFADVPPGNHILEAWWRSLDEIHVHRNYLTLAEDEHRDLGVLRSRPTSHVVESAIRRGESVVPPQEIFRRVPTVRVWFDAHPSPGNTREAGFILTLLDRPTCPPNSTPPD